MKKEFDIFKYMEKFDYEQLVFFQDEATGLKGITCIHDTTLGPALGGTRLWMYEDETEAIEDVLRLGKGMTYKSASAGLELGGGKTVLIGTPDMKTEAYMRALGRYVESLNGRYITAEDVNINTIDCINIAKETDHVVGLPGKSGNPSPVTAWGVFMALKASLVEKYGTDDLTGKTIAVQGAGQTGFYLIEYLLGKNFLSDKFTVSTPAKIYFTEVNEGHIARMKDMYPEVEFVNPDDIYGLDVDVFAPCALGGVLNDDTINQLKCDIVCGSSNNVLKDIDVHGKLLDEKGILYAPDFVANGGGVINVYHEIIGYQELNAIIDVEKIYERILEIYTMAKENKVTTATAANMYAENRIESIKKVRSNFIPSIESGRKK